MTLYATLLMFAIISNPAYTTYYSPTDEYSMDVANNIQPKRYAQKDGYLDVFQYLDTANGKTSAGYMMTVLKTAPNGDFHFASLTSKEFKSGYQDACKCEVTNPTLQQYDKEKGVSYATSYKHGRTTMVGYATTFQKGKYIYVINFSSTKEAIGAYSKDYTAAINSFDVHPTQMIVSNYKNHAIAAK